MTAALAPVAPAEVPPVPPVAQVAASSSFYAGMRVLPRLERRAMYDIYGFCRAVDDIADEPTGDIGEQGQALAAWRADFESLYAGGPPGRAGIVADAVRRYGLDKADFLAVIDGMQMDLDGVRAPDLATFELYCDRVAVAVGRLSVKVFGMPPGPGAELAHHLGRALQFTNILRDVDEDAEMGRLYLPREYLLAEGISSDDPAVVLQAPALDGVCRRVAATAQVHYREAARILAARPPGRLAAPRLMGAIYGEILRRMQRRGWAPPRRRVKPGKAMLLWLVLRNGF
jgi:squalene synthase HpnD